MGFGVIMPNKFADQRLSVLKHHAEMILAFITDVDEDDGADTPEAELIQQYNDAEELSDIILNSMTLTLPEWPTTALLPQPLTFKTSTSSSPLRPKSIWLPKNSRRPDGLQRTIH